MRAAQLQRALAHVGREYQLRSERGRVVMAFEDEARARAANQSRGLRLFVVERHEAEIAA